MSQEYEVLGELNEIQGHDLVQVEPEEPGPLRNSSSNGKALDISWKSSSRTVDEDIVSGLSNEDVWMLIRRFNKQIYYVKAISDAPSGELDLNRAEDEQFPPEKLRMTLERFYMSVLVGLSSFFKHIARLRSWKEPLRTFVFCAAYFVAWFQDLLIPAIMSFLGALILCPSARTLLFPCSPPAISEPEGMAKSANNLTSQDSITGAPERYKGEAVEQEASNLVNSVANVAMESAAAKYGQGISNEDSDDGTESLKDDVSPKADETGENEVPDKTKRPMKKKIGKATDKAMLVVSDITDIWERFSNIFSPTPPFYGVTARLRLISILVGVSVSSLVLSSHFILRTVSLLAGVGFFGDPIFQWTLKFLNERVPDWKQHLDLNKSLLKGVPTNAQLTLTLLRIGELNSAPLPPPPSSKDEPAWPIRRKKTKLAISDKPANPGTSSSLEVDTINQSQPTATTTPPKKSKRRWVSKVLKFVRRTIATAVKGHIALDRAMAIAGSEHTKSLISLLSNRGWISAPFGPLKFDAKFERKRGAVVIDSSLEPPVLYFTTYQSAGLDDLRLESRKKGSVLFQIPVTDITELKKTEGLGWKAKMIVELAAGSKEAADGLIISGKESEQSYHVTGMRARNQLFNRLVAIGAQYWESR
ncbi:hypothetical protein BDV59DRAFT_164965 [Aspergillus ambiguus]|uniref:uncharacterized protein n=1 Tax=Aspergillus ambiguus TaxID=176160 RepID=UPI003CCD56F7